MELKIGLKFKKYYNKNNINNIASCEVRSIVDDFIILWCEKDTTKISKSQKFFQIIDKHDFEFNVKNKIYLTF
jgi:hypothetical protein